MQAVFSQEQIEQIKRSQDYARRKWEGPSAQRIGKPGKSTIVNNKVKRDKENEEQLDDLDLQQLIFRMACKIKELDELKELRMAHGRFNRVQK